MNKEGTAILAVVAVGGLVFALARKAASADNCRTLEAGAEYFFIYTGPAQTFYLALGECYNVIYTIEVWDDYYIEYLPPSDPVNDIIQPGSVCRVVVQAPCQLCQFTPQ